MKTKLFSLALALLMSVSLFAQCGTCGPNLTWTLQNGVLTISGSGNMNDYSYGNAPWYSYRLSITSITIPNSVTSIGEWAFQYCSRLTSITIPNSVTSIGISAFRNCSSLTSITIPDSVISIGNYAFENCNRLDSVIWNARNAEDFNTSPFNNSSGRVKVLILGDSVQHIPANLCNGMTRIKEITIPANVETIGENVFLGCDSLAKVDVYNIATWSNTDFTYTSYPLRTAELFINGNKPTRIVIPEGVTKVGAYAFTNCPQVTEVLLPPSVTEVGESAFANESRLQTITLDSALTNIGDSAFNNCPYLLTIYVNMVFPPLINVSVFANCGLLSGIDCYVPEGSLALYRKTPVWAEFNLHENETDLQSTQAENNSTQIKKILVDGQLYILLPDGTRYDATGKKME